MAPSNRASRSTSTTVVVPIKPYSDGDATHAPSVSTHTEVDPPTIYLEKIANLWMENRGETKPDTQFILDRLPQGYTVWERPRTNKPKHFDKWLFGHPDHKYFDSPNRFWPHFLHLMNNGGSNIGCPCTVCGNAKGSTRKTTIKAPTVSSHFTPMPSSKPVPRPNTISTINSTLKPTAKPGSTATAVAKAPSRASSPNLHMFKQSAIAPIEPAELPKQRGRPKQMDAGLNGYVDEEGTPDVYRQLINTLKVRQTLDTFITEKLSLDWRAERALIPKVTEQAAQNAWIPRVGEIVVFVRRTTDDEQLLYNPKARLFEIYNNSKHAFDRPAKWEAGVVTQVPHADCPPKMKDLTKESNTNFQITYSGFRIEPLPDPNSQHKSLSTQHKYIPLNRIRPFALWKELTGHLPQEEKHCTIEHALTVMASFCLIERFRFKGKWPEADIFCKGIFMGAELIVPGDFVRLFPAGMADGLADTVTNVMKVQSIKLHVTNLHEASDNDYDGGHPYNSTVAISGTVWSLIDDSIADDETEVDERLSAYGRWQARCEPGKQLQVSFSRIIGRCFEYEAFRLWCPGQESRYLSKGLDGVYSSRFISAKLDNRIKDGKCWYWADTRTDALDLHTFNGYNVSKYDDERDPKQWRRFIKVIEGAAGNQEREATKKQDAAQRSLRNLGMFAHQPNAETPSTSSVSVISRLHQNNRTSASAQLSANTSSSTSAAASRATSPKKRPRSSFLADTARSHSFTSINKPGSGSASSSHSKAAASPKSAVASSPRSYSFMGGKGKAYPSPVKLKRGNGDGPTHIRLLSDDDDSDEDEAVEGVEQRADGYDMEATDYLHDVVQSVEGGSKKKTRIEVVIGD